MDNEKQASSSGTGNIAEQARALMNATTDAAGEKVKAAGQSLAAALEGGKKTLGRIKEKAVAGAKATHEAVQEHPYHALALAFGVGALVGFLLSRRSSPDRD